LGRTFKEATIPVNVVQPFLLEVFLKVVPDERLLGEYELKHSQEEAINVALE
jgi:hypothetical protein